MSFRSKHSIPAAVMAGLLSWTPVPAVALGLDAIQDMVARGQLQQALEELAPLIRSQPGNPDARFLRGVIYAQMGDADRAISIFHSLTQEFPDLSEPYNNLAVLRASQGDYEKAAEALRQAIKIQPDYDTAHENLGDVYAKMAALAYDRAFDASQQNRRARSKSDVLAKMLNQRVDKGDIVRVVHQPEGPAAVETRVAAPHEQAPVPLPVPEPRTVAAKPGRCYEVGPIAAEPDMAQLATWLRARGADVDADVRGGAPQVQRVYIPAQPGRPAQQVVDTLRRKGVKDFMWIRGGELDGAVSVGVFSRDDSVQRRRAELRKIGFETRVQGATDDKVQQYWLYVDGSNAEPVLDPGAFLKSFPKHPMNPITCK